MRTIVSILVLSAGCAVVAGEAQAQSAAEEQAHIRAIKDERVEWRDQSPRFGWLWIDTFGRFSGSVAIYWDFVREGPEPGRPARLRFVARRLERSVGSPDKIRWSDSDQCPALNDVVRSFQTISAPTTVIPEMTLPPEVPVVVADGVGVTLWSNSAREGNRRSASYEISSGSGGPIANWASTTANALAGCWREQSSIN